MTTVADTAEAEAHEDHTHEHPPASTYWTIAGILAVITGLELSTYWWPEDMSGVAAVAIIIMMSIKFVLVALFFMHLRFDDSMLSRIFFFGLLLAAAVYMATLSAFVFWTDSGNVDQTFPDPPYSKPLPAPTE